MSKPRSSRRTFPFKLWSLINSDKETGLEWTPDGNMIIIDKKVFVQKCLGEGCTFKTRKFLSITKQLNVYGFVQHFPQYKSRSNPMFASPFFKRDYPGLLSHFSRKHVTLKESPPAMQESRASPKKAVGRPALASIGNLQEFKSRTQPMRKARLTKVYNSPDRSSSSSALKIDTSAKSTPTAVSPEAINSPYTLRKFRTTDPVATARARFYDILQKNVRGVMALQAGLTSSNKSSKSSPLITDVSNKPVRFPPPPNTKSDKVMLSGYCPMTPPLGFTYSVNPNAFINSPWREYYNLSIANGEAYIIDITD